jgi:predicted enzyme related to lactoylglutathione lyase
MAKNQVCHIEWTVTDLVRAQRFYAAMFDWSFQEFGSDMVVFGAGTEHIGGLTKAETVSIGTSPSVWIETDDIDAQLEKALALGGVCASPKSPVPGVGWSAVAADPDGNPIGLVQFNPNERQAER